MDPAVDGERDDGAAPRPPVLVPLAVVPQVAARLRRPTGWWVAPLYLVMALVLVPWVVVLAETLPDRAVSHNYRLAWVGFDVLLGASMTRTAWLAWRRSPYVVNVASATATLLVVDAWFDVTTASERRLLESCALAMFVELPAAVLSLVIAGRAQDHIARSGMLRPPRNVLAWRRGAAPATVRQDASATPLEDPSAADTVRPEGSQSVTTQSLRVVISTRRSVRSASADGAKR